jgi:undecaprenyl diphosphate synthase
MRKYALHSNTRCADHGWQWSVGGFSRSSEKQWASPGSLIGEKSFASCEKIGIEYITLFAFSSENFSRPHEEVSFLMNLCEKLLKRFWKNFVEKGIRFRMIGDPFLLPSSLQNAIAKLENDTAKFREFNVTVALNYGARNEIVRAVENILRDPTLPPETITWEVLRNYLYTADLPDPDLIIRTSGEQRLSNFLLLQSAYAEFFFTKTLWPDFGEIEFLAAIEDYKNREKRMGSVNEKTST